MKRKLASVQYVHGITPIEGADNIECAHVLGWKCVVKKGEFKVGDYCVYFEVDSFLPICAQYEFLRKNCYKNDSFMGEGFRLKTQRFRGQISQGLILPVSILSHAKEYSLGEDVSDILQVRKWEIEETVTSSGTIIGEMPHGIPKTDELRVQAYPELLDEFAGLKYYISTKLDGTSVTMYWKDGKFGVCGRNYEYADDGKCAMWEYAKQHQIEQRLRANKLCDLAIQGEFCGGGIQKNRLRLQHPEWYIFTIIDLQTNKRVDLERQQELCELLGLCMVPIEEVGDNFAYSSVEKLLERAKGKYDSGMNKEGIVIRPVVPVYSKIVEGPLSMKIINNEYLLKE